MVTIMLTKCPLCSGELKTVHKKILIDMPNPGQLLVDRTFQECQRCNGGFFDEKDSKEFGKELKDSIEKAKKNKPKRLPSGSFIV